MSEKNIAITLRYEVIKSIIMFSQNLENMFFKHKNCPFRVLMLAFSLALSLTDSFLLSSTRGIFACLLIFAGSSMWLAARDLGGKSQWPGLARFCLQGTESWRVIPCFFYVRAILGGHWPRWNHPSRPMVTFNTVQHIQIGSKWHYWQFGALTWYFMQY